MRLQKTELYQVLDRKIESIRKESQREILRDLKKQIRKLPFKWFDINLTKKGYINLGELGEYLIQYNLFNDKTHRELQNNHFDYIDENGTRYEFKTYILEQPTSVKREMDIIYFSMNGSLKGYYKIDKKDSINLVGKKITVADIVKYGKLVKAL